MSKKPAKPIEVFYSYSHKDEELRDELEKHLSILKRQGVITGWHDRRIGVGREWEGEIDTHLNTADVILLLISADFLASDYCYDVEMKRAMERHEAGETRVIPVILRPVVWKGAPFGKLQALPKDAKPVTSWPNPDLAFENVAQGIQAAVEELTDPSASPPPSIGPVPSDSDRISLKGIILASGLSFVLVVIFLLILFQPLRCVLQYRMNEAMVALVAVLLSGIVALFSGITMPRRVREVLWCCMLGGDFALLPYLLVMAFLQPPLESDCRYLFTPTPMAASSFTPTSTSTPTLATIVKPDSTPKPTNTLVVPPTNTSTPELPTDTPFPNTPISTLTIAPTSVTDAVVKVEALNLRSGPGTDCDSVRVLKQGNSLKVTGKNLTGDWLKVITSDGEEGWVAATCLEINIPLAGIAVAQTPPRPTPTYTPTPAVTPTPVLLPPTIVLEPEDEASFIGPVLLKWQWDKSRAPNEVFSVRVRREGETELCHHTQAKDTQYWGDLTRCTAGKHYWNVALVRDLAPWLPENDKNRWQDLSESSAERCIYYTPGEEPWKPPEPNGPEPTPTRD